MATVNLTNASCNKQVLIYVKEETLLVCLTGISFEGKKVVFNALYISMRGVIFLVNLSEGRPVSFVGVSDLKNMIRRYIYLIYNCLAN